MARDGTGEQPSAWRTRAAWLLVAVSASTAAAAYVWNRAVTLTSDAVPLSLGDVVLATVYPLVGALVLARQQRTGSARVPGRRALGPTCWPGSTRHRVRRARAPGPAGARAAPGWRRGASCRTSSSSGCSCCCSRTAARCRRAGAGWCGSCVASPWCSGRSAACSPTPSWTPRSATCATRSGSAAWPNYLLLARRRGRPSPSADRWASSALLRRLRRAARRRARPAAVARARRRRARRAVRRGRSCCPTAPTTAPSRVPALHPGLRCSSRCSGTACSTSRSCCPGRSCYALLTGAVLASYAGAVVLVGMLTADRRSAYALVAVVALLAAGGRDACQAGVDRLLYGERRDPYAV